MRKVCSSKECYKEEAYSSLGLCNRLVNSKLGWCIRLQGLDRNMKELDKEAGLSMEEVLDIDPVYSSLDWSKEVEEYNKWDLCKASPVEECNRLE